MKKKEIKPTKKLDEKKDLGTTGFSEIEKNAIENMHKNGVDNKAIARKLKKPVETVELYLVEFNQKEKKKLGAKGAGFITEGKGGRKGIAVMTGETSAQIDEVRKQVPKYYREDAMFTINPDKDKK